MGGIGIGWRERANCRGIDTNLFYPEVSGGDWTTPRRVCANCEVRVECREEALSVGADDQFGIWGGLGPAQRRDIKTERNKAAADG
jgi:WhiB family redox-sensing transcriptional regulator